MMPTTRQVIRDYLLKVPCNIRQCDAAGQMDDEADCPDCHGTGVTIH